MRTTLPRPRPASRSRALLPPSRLPHPARTRTRPRCWQGKRRDPSLRGSLTLRLLPPRTPPSTWEPPLHPRPVTERTSQCPPPYSVATSLPTYDEAENAKAAALATSVVDVMPLDDEFPPRDDFSDADQLRVGNDGIFMLAFFMAFLFNWIGFCLSFCLTNTIAGRYGAICGFGLSLIKWILIVRFSDYFTGYFNGQYWLWWIFLLLGILLFFRGFINYLKVRNMSENMATNHRTRLFFLY
ncbi:hypothetical protein KUCAC02_001331 [Chaenocephalus aceratus]|uniref:Uncharacterized protein n=1 Tax=Chaenocephalus aceratus TaxID=36190 RepID=A0ACB9XYK5_CHAAC|nr:hypothetical protein KUCAC02_001331 [Chaenocephalus aceratus]